MTITDIRSQFFWANVFVTLLRRYALVDAEDAQNIAEKADFAMAEYRKRFDTEESPKEETVV